MRFVLATANPGKIQEMREMLPNRDIQIVTRDDLGIELVVDETGSTFRENALIKAKAICEVSGLPAIADDSGLIVDALDGGPGVNTSSFGGTELDGKQRYLYLIEQLSGVEHRNAKFVCTIVCVFPDGEVLTAEGECSGYITREPRGENGFGYDPVFCADGYNQTMAELEPEEKHRISHRGKALKEFAQALESWKRGAV